MIDRELSLPKSWTDDQQRCAEAGIPEGKIRFATKPKPAQQMLERLIAKHGKQTVGAGHPGSRVRRPPGDG